MPTVEIEINTTLGPNGGHIGDNEFKLHIGDRGGLEGVEMKVYGRTGIAYWADLPMLFDPGRAMECEFRRQAQEYYERFMRSDYAPRPQRASVVGERNRMGA